MKKDDLLGFDPVLFLLAMNQTKTTRTDLGIRGIFFRIPMICALF
jgi:hypothetical protein